MIYGAWLALVSCFIPYLIFTTGCFCNAITFKKDQWRGTYALPIILIVRTNTTLAVPVWWTAGVTIRGTVKALLDQWTDLAQILLWLTSTYSLTKSKGILARFAFAWEVWTWWAVLRTSNASIITIIVGPIFTSKLCRSVCDLVGRRIVVSLNSQKYTLTLCCHVFLIHPCYIRARNRVSIESKLYRYFDVIDRFYNHCWKIIFFVYIVWKNLIVAAMTTVKYAVVSWWESLFKV